MNYEVILSARFKRTSKRLAKKYRSYKADLADLIDSLEVNPTQGTSLGRSCYKIRIGIQSKGAGKRGGARVVTYVITDDEQVVLLTIYDKKDKTDLDPGELDEMLNDLPEWHDKLTDTPYVAMGEFFLFPLFSAF